MQIAINQLYATRRVSQYAYAGCLSASLFQKILLQMNIVTCRVTRQGLQLFAVICSNVQMIVEELVLLGGTKKTDMTKLVY